MSTPTEIDPAAAKTLDGLLQQADLHTPAPKAVDQPPAPAVPSPKSTPAKMTGGILAQLSAGPKLEDTDLDDEAAFDDTSNVIPRLSPRKGGSVDLVVLPAETRVSLHVLDDDPDIKGYFFCPSEMCPVCALGISKLNFILRVAYDIGSARMGVLPIPVSSAWKPKRSDGNFSQLSDEFIRAMKKRDPLTTLVSIGYAGNGYTVTTKDLPSHSQIPQDIIDAFDKRLSTNPEYLTSCYRKVTVEELREAETIGRRLKAKGL